MPFQRTSPQTKMRLMDDDQDVVARLRESVADELNAQVALRNGSITADDVVAVAEAVAANVDYAFECTWSPRWEGNRP